MNTAWSVAYGWYVDVYPCSERQLGVLLTTPTTCVSRAVRVALSVAASVAYYFARQDIEARRRDQAARNSRSLDRKGWEEQVYDYEMAKAGKARAGVSPAPPPPPSAPSST